MLRVLRSGWLTTASEAKAFEEEFARAVGTRHALAVSSCTAGLHLALEALGVGPGDKVITTPYTFTASAEVIRYLGADPYFVDVRATDLNIDPNAVGRALESVDGVKAILPVHVGGHPCAMETLGELATRHGVSLVEDAAHALPARLGGRYLGTLGDVGVFSFYANKTITTGEGGMIVTGDDALAERMSVMRLHGIDREVWERYTTSAPSWHYQVIAAGFKYNLPDLLAAIGRVQLRKAESFRQMRALIAERYGSALADLPYLTLPAHSDDSSWHLYVIRLHLSSMTIGRDEFISRLAESGVETSVHYIPLHLMPYYRDRYDFRPSDFPVSLAAYEAAISLPIYPAMSEAQVEQVAAAVRRVGDAAAK